MWRDDAALLDMFLAVSKVLKYSRHVTKSRFMKNEILQDAIVRQLEIVGEAANKVSEEMQQSHSEIPWIDIIGMRNRLVHEYFRVDLARVWETIRTSIPELHKKLKPLVPKK